MSLPEESVAVNTLPEVTAIPTGKKLIFTDPDTNEGGIITLENLTKQILQNLTSQTFALDQGNLTLLQALNQLNSNVLSIKCTKINIGNIGITNQDANYGYYSDNIKVDIPKNSEIISVYPCGKYSAGIIVCKVDANAFVLSCANKVTLPQSREATVWYIEK